MSSAETKAADAGKQKRISKIKRQPNAVAIAESKLTGRSIEVIAAIARYRFLPTSLLVRLIEGNEDVTHRHLQQLFHKGFINRFAFPKTGGSNEFNYYLDDAKSLSLLAEHGFGGKEILDFEAVRNNKAKAYFKITDVPNDSPGRMLFLHHELMISRFHFMLELGCRKSGGKVELVSWDQGTALHSSVEDLNSGELLPHRPDAFFTLNFPGGPEEEEHRSNFFYEADRNRTSIPKMMTKLRGHYEFIRQEKFREKYAIRRIRAVLIETLDTRWAEQLRRAAVSICPIPLFWLTASSIFETKKAANGGNSDRQMLFLRMPGIVLQKVWATTSDDRLIGMES